MKKALIVIDYTNDFVADNGALTVGAPAIVLENRISTLIETFSADGELIVSMNDFHQENDPYHPEYKLYPPHNIHGTPGRKAYGLVESSLAKAVFGDKTKTLELPKTRYSAFCGTPLELLLRERNITEIHLVGVCTDICVLHTAVDAYNKGFKIFVHVDAVASFNSDGHLWALQHFQNSLGATLLQDGLPVKIDGDVIKPII